MVFRITSISFFFCLSLAFSTVVPEPAYGIRLTPVQHLFDITHDFREPSDISVSNKGMIYVVDGVNNKIKVFNQDGTFAFAFGSRGSLNGQLQFPLGIDIDRSGNVYVADSGNHRVQIFNAHGKFISQIRIPPREGIPADPTDVAVDESRNKLYVADNDNHYVLAYDLTDLKLMQTFGTPGAEEREFRYPFLMALDKSEYLYIVDVINTRIQVFNPDGLFVSVIGGWGVEKGNFFRPKGIAFDKKNMAYVSDSYMGVIQVFDTDGDFYSALGDPVKKTVKKFNSPVGLFIDNKNRLYVVEMFAEKVSVYRIEREIE